MAAAQKLCKVCGTDVAGKKRVKDPKGLYYCEPCYESRKSAARAPANNNVQASSHASGAGAAVAELPALDDLPNLDDLGPLGDLSTPGDAPAAPPPADDGMLDLAPERKQPGAREEQLLGCARCRKLLPEKQVRNMDGEFVCNACLAKDKKASAQTAGKSRSSLAPKSKSADSPEKSEHAEKFADTLTGGLTIAAATLGGSFFILFAICYFIPEKGFGGPLAATVYAGVLTVFIALRAAALIISMVVAGRLLGGISFGYIGSAIYKSLAIFLVFSVAEIFMDRSESFAMLGYGFKGLIFILAFIAVFRIDFFEAMILSVINFFVSMGLSIVMLALLVALSASLLDRIEQPMDPGSPSHVTTAPADDGN